MGCGPQTPDISIHDAAHTGNIEAVKKHLASGADLNTKDSEGGTPLHHAAWNGHKEVAELLIEKGAFPKKSGGGGGSRTPVPIKPIQDVYMLSQGWIFGLRITA